MIQNKHTVIIDEKSDDYILVRMDGLYEPVGTSIYFEGPNSGYGRIIDIQDVITNQNWLMRKIYVEKT